MIKVFKIQIATKLMMKLSKHLYNTLCMYYSEHIMGKITTIQLDKNVVDALNSIKRNPRQTYNDLIQELVLLFNNVKQKNQYDEFLHKIQQPKMKELWGNKEDGDWENV